MRARLFLFALAASTLVGGCRAGDGQATGAAAPNESPLADAQPTETAAAGRRTWKFDDDAVGTAPDGFTFGRTGFGRFGRWEIAADPTSTSAGRVLAQLDADATDDRFPIAVADSPALRDLRLSVRCKPVSGEVDQAVGLVIRYRDQDNYYVTRANALESNIRLYYVKDGRRQQIATWNGSVTAGVWHDFEFEARADHFEVWWDGSKVIDHDDPTFREAGRCGVWTKSDSVSHFDDLVVEPL